MKIKLVTITTALFFSGCDNSPQGVEQFNGFDWGTDYKEVMRIRGGEPSYSFFDSDTFSILAWTVDDETVNGVPISEVEYHFQGSCSSDCPLYAGTYTAAENTYEIFEELKGLLASEYGQDYTNETEVTTAFGYRGEEEEAPQQTEVSYTWKFSDKSEIILFIRELDKDYTAFSDQEYFAGIQDVQISYYNPEYIIEGERMENITKGSL